MRADRRPSVTWSVLLWLLVPLSLVVLAFLGEAWVSARRATDRLYDQMLVASAISISEAVDRTYGDLVEDEIIALLRNTTQERIFYRIIGPSRSYLTGYEDLRPPGDETALEPGVPRISDMTYRGQRLRAVSLRFFGSDALMPDWITVHVGMTRNERDAATLASVTSSALRLGVLLAGAGVLAFFAVRRGLRSLLQFRDQLDVRSATDLSPIQAALPSDLRSIGEALNTLVARLRQAMEHEREFIDNASHQLRSPLTSLQLRAQLLQRELPDGPLRDRISALVDDTRASARLADQLLVYSRNEAGLRGAETTRFDLAALVRQMVPELLLMSERQGCDIGFSLQPEPTFIQGVELLCREIVMNLVDNAMRHGGDGTVVDVAVAQTGSQVILTVTDDGPGVPPDEREKIFGRFQRGASAGAGGSGLGLAIVRQIVDRLGAMVDLESRPEAETTRFRVIFKADLRDAKKDHNDGGGNEVSDFSDGSA
ncbi:two-component system sensor histidine kinase TctE [Rhizobium subbaraonis]|uniref:histidine kinase n=1 Tax=Rhizobium subbaraonis TaxID=908946 RepID=A0A285UU24_9HYPH|nr:sensor histidine kinase [Rhizobium subbaraonis]SOC45187.1 two-component system sensor histidine kinase TctE [Rhizobium subbaraonis]